MGADGGRGAVFTGVAVPLAWSRSNDERRVRPRERPGREGGTRGVAGAKRRRRRATTKQDDIERCTESKRLTEIDALQACDWKPRGRGGGVVLVVHSLCHREEGGRG